MTIHPTSQRPQLDSAVVIGGSAGAIDSLLSILMRLPKAFPLPVIVLIHTVQAPVSAIAAALAPRSVLPVREPEDKDPIVGGTVFVAPAGYHLLVDRGPSFALSVDAPVNFSRPSIDVLFESAAEVFRAGLIGVVLSGANADGARGLASIRGAGGLALVENPSNAAVREMPRAALAACPDAEALSANAIADRLVSIACAEAEVRKK